MQSKLQWTRRAAISLFIVATVPVLALGVFGPASLKSRSAHAPELVGHAPWEGAVAGARAMKRGQPSAKSMSDAEIFLNNWQYTAVAPSPTGPAIRNRG